MNIPIPTTTEEQGLRDNPVSLPLKYCKDCGKQKQVSVRGLCKECAAIRQKKGVERAAMNRIVLRINLRRIKK